MFREEERVRLILESTAKGIYGIDPRGICTFINPAALRLLGFSSNRQVLGRNFHKLCHHTRPDSSPFPVEECGIQRSTESGEAHHEADDLLWRTDGTSFAAEIWAHPLIREGRVLGTVVAFTDRTKQKQQETALRCAKEAAEAANRAKSEFRANMSHEMGFLA